MRDMEDLREYVELTEDRQLGMMADMVDDYGNEIPELIRSIKDRHIGDDDKTQADMIFTTVHRCKGMEYDMVRLADDFITEDSLLRQLEKDRQPASIRRLSEEVNLLYVAVTRTRNKLIIPSSVASPASDPSPHIIVLTDTRRSNRSGTPYSRSGSQPKPRAADRKWTDTDDRQLTHMYEEGKTLKDMVLHFERSASAIQMRIRKLNLS
jgi:superfamily I DNA/RNA helicase